MQKTLSKHGNSLALVIDRPILDLLGIEADTPLTIRTDGTSLIVTPVRDAARSSRLDELLETVNRDHGDALRKLGE